MKKKFLMLPDGVSEISAQLGKNLIVFPVLVNPDSAIKLQNSLSEINKQSASYAVVMRDSSETEVLGYPRRFSWGDDGVHLMIDVEKLRSGIIKLGDYPLTTSNQK